MCVVFFDLDGTLLDHQTAEREAASVLHRSIAPSSNCNFEEFCRAWHIAHEKFFRLYLNGAISFQEQRRARIREVSGKHLTDQVADDLFSNYLAAYESSWRLYPDVIDCLESLEENTLGVITNGNGIQQRKKLERLGLSRWFRFIVTSEDVGYAKPAHQIFHAACNQAAVHPATTFYVGDHFESDAVAAQSAGLIGIWLNRAGESREPCHVHEIRTLNALPKLVKQ